MRANLILFLTGLLAFPQMSLALKESAPPEHEGGGKRAMTRHADHGRNGEVPAIFREISPHKAGKLDWMREHKPDHFRQALRRLQRMAREMERFRTSDMDEFTRRAGLIHLEDDVARMGEEFRRAENDKDRARIKKELLEKLEELFDMKEEATRARIGRMEKDIQELKDRLDKRRKNRARIIEKKLGKLTEEDDLEF